VATALMKNYRPLAALPLLAVLRPALRAFVSACTIPRDQELAHSTPCWRSSQIRA